MTTGAQLVPTTPRSTYVLVFHKQTLAEQSELMSVSLIAFIQSCGWPNSRVVGPPTKCQKQLNVKLGYISLATNFTVVTFPFYHVF